MTTEGDDLTLEAAPEGATELTADDGATVDDSSGDTAGSVTEGQPRDEAGRFAPKAGAETAQTIDAPATDPTVAPIAAEAPTVVDAAAIAPAGTPAATPAAPETLWSIKAQGSQFEIPGTRVNADGTIAMTPQGADLVHRYIGRGIRYEQEMPQLRRELEQLRNTRTEQDEHNAIVAQEFARMATLTDGELVDAVREFRAAYPVLQKEAENRLLRRQISERQRAEQPDPEQQAAEFVASVRSTLDVVFEESKTAPWAKGLAAEDLADLRQAAEQYPGVFLVVAERDDPDAGIRKGERVFHDGQFAQLMQRLAAPIARARSASEQAAAAAKRNATATQTTITAPPSVGGNRTAPAAPKPAAAAPAKGKDERAERDAWRREMGLTI